VLEYFWGKCREQGNPNQYTIEQFRYPGHPPQSRETAILAICDAVEAASRTLKRPDPAAIDSLVQRIVYGKLHLGQLDESGLSMSDLRRISDSLRETIRHANHGRIEYPWQKAGQDASASVMTFLSNTPRLDSLDRSPGRDSTAPPVSTPGDSDAALATTANARNPVEPPALAAGSAPPLAAQVRAGTARNAQPDAPAVAPAAASHSASEAGAFAAQREVSGVERRPPTSHDVAAPPAARELTTTVPGRAPGPLPPPPDIISPATFEDAPARKRAATLPPIQARRPPTPAPPIAIRAATDAGASPGAPAPAIAAPRRAATETGRGTGPPMPPPGAAMTQAAPGSRRRARTSSDDARGAAPVATGTVPLPRAPAGGGRPRQRHHQSARAAARPERPPARALGSGAARGGARQHGVPRGCPVRDADGAHRTAARGAIRRASRQPSGDRTARPRPRQRARTGAIERAVRGGPADPSTEHSPRLRRARGEHGDQATRLDGGGPGRDAATCPTAVGR
jgi:hypothetical protein